MRGRGRRPRRQPGNSTTCRRRSGARGWPGGCTSAAHRPPISRSAT